MGTITSLARKEKLAKIDDMLIQRINEVEESRNNLADEVQSYREEFFANLCRDIFNVKK